MLTENGILPLQKRPLGSGPDWGRDLPIDVLAVVAQACGHLSEARGMHAVCKTWTAGFDASVVKMTYADGKQCPPLPRGGTLAERFPGLTELHIGNCQVAEEGLVGCLQGLKKLTLLSLVPFYQYPRKIDILGCLLEGPGLAHLQCLSITELNLSYCSNLRDNGLVLLQGLPITGLSLHACCNITCVGLEALSGLPLTFLNLGHCEQLVDTDLEALFGLSELTALDVMDCPKLSVSGLDYLWEVMDLEFIKAGDSFDVHDFDFDIDY